MGKTAPPKGNSRGAASHQRPSRANAILRVREAHEMAQGNVNPQLILADLLRGLREDLVGAVSS